MTNPHLRRHGGVFQLKQDHVFLMLYDEAVEQFYHVFFNGFGLRLFIFQKVSIHFFKNRIRSVDNNNKNYYRSPVKQEGKNCGDPFIYLRVCVCVSGLP